MTYRFDLIIKEIFFDLIKKKKLEVTLVDNQTVMFKSRITQNYVEFIMSRDGVDVLYIMPINEINEIQYNIGEYISNKILPQDRLYIDLHYETFFDKIIIELKILNNTFKRLEGFIFSTDNSWLEDYKNSPYFEEPRIMNFNNTK